MPKTITELTYRVSLISETLDSFPEEAQRLEKALGADTLELGAAYMDSAIALLLHLEDITDDHTALEQSRRGDVELESWNSTTLSIFKRALGGETRDWNVIRGDDIDCGEYGWNAKMRAWRTISFFRNHVDLWERLSRRRRVADDLMRSLTLLRKTTRLSNKHHRSTPQNDGYADPAELRDQLDAWLDQFSAAATQVFSSTPVVLGLFGINVEGIARPLGGTAFDVLRHQRAQTTPPTQKSSTYCPQWTPGASGNNENYWEST